LKNKEMNKVINSKLNFLYGFLVIFLPNVVYTQVWFDIGLNGAIGTGFLTNSNLFNDTRFNVAPAFNNTFALKIGINPTEQHSAVLELGYMNRSYEIDQALVPNKDPNTVYTQNISFSGLQTGLFYRRTIDATFIELGSVMNFISNQKLVDPVNPQNEQNIYISDKSIRGVFGISGFILGTERVTLVTGIRFLYDFKDLRATNATGEQYPFQNYNDPSLFQPVRGLDVQLNFELNVSLGFLYRARCGKRSLVFEL
jgi:hypothetical protein